MTMKRFLMPCTAMEVSLVRAVLLSKACHHHLLLSKLRGEDGLDVSCRPYDPSLTRMCMDEMGKNAGHQTHISQNEASPGQVARKDDTYENEVRANLFIAYQPLKGLR
jgi:hypothetical protein